MCSGEAVVFCAREGSVYEHFVHEADAMLLSLASSVGAGVTTRTEAFGKWERYRDHRPELYELSAQEFEEEYGEGFPSAETVFDTLPASSRFWRKAATLGIRGAGFSDDVSPASGEVFEVRDGDAFAALQDRLRRSYRIVEFDQWTGYCGDWSPEEAETQIAKARES